MSKETAPQTGTDLRNTDNEMLRKLQEETFGYFIDRLLVKNGMIADKTQPGCPSSIAVIGLGLSCYIVGVERGYITREDAIDINLQILRFLISSHQGLEADATGYKGFYYHF